MYNFDINVYYLGLSRTQSIREIHSITIGEKKKK